MGRMPERPMPPSVPPPGVPDAVRVQILATEHWSLLAARNITYSAIFSRTSIFLTVVSAAVVALALVAQAQATSCVIWSIATVAARTRATSSLGPISTPYVSRMANQRFETSATFWPSRSNSYW